MIFSESELTQAYEKATYRLRLKETYIVYITVLILMPSGGLLDYVYYPDAFKTLISIRGISVLILLILFALPFVLRSNLNLRLASTAWPLVINIAICLMIYKTEGVLSPYYAGLNLVIVGAGFMTLTFFETIFIVISTIILYLVTIRLHTPSVYIDHFNIVFNNVFFILVTGLVGTIASYVRENQRRNEFELQYQLDKRNKQLAELDRIKTNFFANISHELRTPLTLILSPVEDLLKSEQPFDFKVIRLLETVKSNSYRLLKLVNDLLNIVRLDEGKKKLECTPLDLKPLLLNIVSSIKHLAETQKIKLEVTPKLSPMVIEGNLNALEKIFINLLNNAIKFTPEGGKITISNTIHDANVSITIVDTGIGIRDEDLPHIFERFQQADSSATRKYQGTGLGLALVYELTRAQNGDIKVSSQLNEGTTFTLTFPLAPMSQTQQKNIPENAHASEATDHNKKADVSPLEKLHQNADYSMHLNRPDAIVLEPGKDATTHQDDADTKPSLLIIEDEPELRSYLVLSLSDEYRVSSATDGEKGLELAFKHKPDLILTDLMLPKVDGLQICANIKGHADFSSTKVILLTARTDEESKMTALENGADDFLTKPFSTTELHTRLKNLANAQQMEKALAQQNRDLSQALQDLKAAESKLLHSEKLNAIGSLASGLLHEVNNPLNYTIAAAQILQRDPSIKADADLAEMVDDIIEGMDRIKAIVKDLHTFAYPEKADIQQPFLLQDAVNSALRFTAHEKGAIDITVSIPENAYVVGSNNHIVQVLINLITNAVKAVSDKTPATIDISATILPADPETNEKRILVEVRDNGTGIDEKTMSRIFEPFFTTRDIGDGLGMGLSICHTIIENHGGSLNVSSEVGKFTVFSFDLVLATNPGEL